MLGIDIHPIYQGTIDYQAVADDPQDIRFAVIKATQGTWLKLDGFHERWQGFEDVGIVPGAYHWFEDITDGKEQADYLIDFIEPTVGNKPSVLMVDMEATYEQLYTAAWEPKAIFRMNMPRADISDDLYDFDKDNLKVPTLQRIKRLEDFCRTIYKRWPRFPAIYSRASWWDPNMGPVGWSDSIPWWMAHYSETIDGPNMPRGIIQPETIWQYSSAGHVQGIGGNVDMNRFLGTEWQLKILTGEAKNEWYWLAQHGKSLANHNERLIALENDGSSNG